MVEFCQRNRTRVMDALNHGCDGCTTCPFSIGEEAEKVQNLGCLPSMGEILDMADKTGRPWGCHSNEDQVCRGYASVAKSLELPLQGVTLKYSAWYHGTDTY